MKMLIFFWLLGLSIFDIRYKKVPVWLVLLGGMIIAGICVSECAQEKNNFMSFCTGTIPGVVLLLLAIGTQKAGWVDGIILMILGSVLGFRRCVLAATLSLILISIISAALLILKRVNKGTTIPYIPFLTMGLVLWELIGT